MAKLNWSASESERVEPFRGSPLAFESTALRLKDSEDYLDDEFVLIESEEEWRAAHPEINIQVDSELASRETGITEDELLIVLVLRDRTLNKFTVVNRWPLPQAPDMPVPLKEALSELSRSRLIEISVLTSSLRVPKNEATVSQPTVARCWHVRSSRFVYTNRSRSSPSGGRRQRSSRREDCLVTPFTGSIGSHSI